MTPGNRLFPGNLFVEFVDTLYGPDGLPVTQPTLTKH